MNEIWQIVFLIGLALSIASFIAVLCIYGRINEFEETLSSTRKYLFSFVSFSTEKILDNSILTDDLNFRVRKLEKLANMTEENKQAPVVHRFYPCLVTHRADSEDFCWNYSKKAYFMQGGKVPEGFRENPCSSSVNCTVEILEYPDGTFRAGWFPGEFRAETSPDAQN